MSSVKTASAGRPSMTMTTLSRASSIRCTGPIGVQPCVSPVATAIPGASISPANPLPPRPSSSLEVRPNSGLAQRCDTRPPTRNAPLAAATSIAALAKSGQRGSAWTSAKMGCDASIQAECRRGSSEPGSSVAEKTRKLSGGKTAVIATAAGSSKISSSAEQTPSPTPPTQAWIPVRSARARTSWGNADAAGSLR